MLRCKLRNWTYFTSFTSIVEFERIVKYTLAQLSNCCPSKQPKNFLKIGHFKYFSSTRGDMAPFHAVLPAEIPLLNDLSAESSWTTEYWKWKRWDTKNDWLSREAINKSNLLTSTYLAQSFSIHQYVSATEWRVSEFSRLNSIANRTHTWFISYFYLSAANSQLPFRPPFTPNSKIRIETSPAALPAI